MASVRVAVRVRPLNEREKKLHCNCIIQMDGRQTAITNSRLPSLYGGKGDSLGREKVKKFTYDYSYWSVDERDGHYVSQTQVYEDLGSEVVQSAYAGYNACIFAYGQTGSGKTYTMMGNEGDQGLIPRISEGLFGRKEDAEISYRTEVSYLEIYNEKVRDLLKQNKKQPQTSLKVREHPKEGPYVQDLSKHMVVSYADVEDMISKGNAARTTAATSMNEQSSRSHAIFTIVFTQAKYEDGVPSEIRSKINLVDLAGSERADTSDATGERLKEGGSINKSLVTLGHCISRLADFCDKPQFVSPGKKQIFIPYRDSVLTWLLKDSLGGNSKTLMIATISPAECNYAETLSTLRYASQAKKIVNKPTVNEDPNVKLIRELREENARLRSLLSEFEFVDVSPTPKDVVETKEKLDRNEARVRKLTANWADKWQSTIDVFQEHNSLALRTEGIGVVLDSEFPYLLVLDGSVLSTGMKLYHLKEGQTKVGRMEPALGQQHIVLRGPHIEPEHCTFLHESGEVYITPTKGALCSVNSLQIQSATKLSQGSLICLGRHYMFRFNHPGEAARLREQMNGEEELQPSRTWQAAFTAQSDAVAVDIKINGHQPSGTAMDNKELSALEEKRKTLEKLEENHCLYEAQRMAQLAEHEAEHKRLVEKEAEIKQIVQESETLKVKTMEAQKEMKRMSTEIEKTVLGHLEEKGRIESEQEQLRRQKEKLERDKAKAREERQRLRAQREKEHARLQLERERIEEEKEDLSLGENLLAEKCGQQEVLINQEKTHINKMRDIEKNVYHKNMVEMRNLVEKEVQHMVEFFTKSASAYQADHDTDDLTEADIENLRLKIAPPTVIPLQYLLQSEQDEEEVEQSSNNMDIFNDLKPPCSENLDTYITYLATQVEEIHRKVCQALQQKYSSVLSVDDHTSGLHEEVLSQFSTLRCIYDDLEKLAQDHSLKRTIENKLEDYDKTLSNVDKFLQIHRVFQEIDAAIHAKQFFVAIEKLEDIHRVFSTLDIESTLECSVHKVLKTELSILREKLLYELNGTWNKMLKWTIPPDAGVQRNKLRTITLEVTDSEHDKEVLASAVGALFRLNKLDSIIKTFCDNILKYMVTGVVSNRGILLQVIDELEKYTLRVVEIPQGGRKQPLVPPVEMFQKLEQVFTFIHRPLARITLPSPVPKQRQYSTPDTKHRLSLSPDIRQRLSLSPLSTPNQELKTNCNQSQSLSPDIKESRSASPDIPPTTLLEKIGRKLGESLFESIYDNCLCHVVPQNEVGREQWDRYTKTVRLSEQFEDTLYNLGYFRESQTALMDKLNNVSVLFANLKSQEILKEAHQLMTQDFMRPMAVTSEHPLGPAHGTDEQKREQFVQACREQTGTTDFKLPPCKISIPVGNLVCLAYDTMMEALAGSTGDALNLCRSVNNIFELYCDVVPTYHRDKLQSHHVMAGLHHNNCMYVAYHLMTMDKSFRRKLQTLTPEVIDENSFAPLIPQIRSLGNDHLTEYLGIKKMELFYHMQDAQGFSCVADDQGNSATLAVKKMLHHLKQISNVWQDVLPVNVYCRAIGSLLDAGLTEIIDSILAIGEFSSEDCDYLQAALSRILQLAVDYFKIDDAKVNPHVALHEYVPSWMKFKEVVLILNSSLQDIADRWADGKGPLAMHVTGDEVKKFIVAIFENTSKREGFLQMLGRRPSVHLT